MKRRYTLFLLTTLSLILAGVALPAASAKRNGKKPAAPARQAKAAPADAAPAAAATTATAPLALPRRAASDPVSSRAVGFAVTPAIRDLPAPEQTKPDPDNDQEIKLKPNKIIRSEAVNPVSISADAAVQTSAPALSASLAAPTTSFEGMSIFDTIAVGQGFLPPDTVGDVGPNHYVQAVNSTWRVWDKAGTPLTPVRSLGDLWATIPGPCANSEDGDPIVLYDSYADRWFISQFCTVANPFNHQLIAVSKTGDPTGAYFVYDFLMPNNKFNDYPKFGVWPDGYYMTDNQFNQAGTAFLGAGVFAFDRAKILAGDPTASYIYFDVENGNPNIGGMLPADADGLTPPPAGAPCPFAYFTATEFGDPADGIRLFDFHADYATPANSTFTERAGSPLPVAAFDPRTPAGRDNIEQPAPATNTTMALDAIADRLMNRLQYRNYGGHESLIANHTVNVGTGTTLATHQAGVRYYELRRSGGNYAVQEQATFAPDATNRWMGSAAADHQGNLAVGYSVSSTTVFPGVRYAARLATDPPGGLHQGEAVLQNGGFVQAHTSSRWGDYSSTNVDPKDDCTFWHTNEYYLDDQPNITAEWHTRIGSFKANPTCQAPQQGTIQVNAVYCDNPALAVQGATVSINGNLYGATGATGQNNSVVSPGSYSVTVNAPGFFPVTTSNVSVSDNGTTVVNVCLTGMPAVGADGTDITAESCAPADDAISPGETVTVNFGLKNTGTASTTNLVATLLSTGGVTSPSAPQPYGVLTPGGPTVARAFSFTADPNAACGQVITATLQLQDGANSLGTATYTFTLGALGPQAGFTRTSGNIATAIPDVSSVDIPINVLETGSITDVNVRLRLNHTFDGDLDISLVHPDGTVVLLSNNRGSGGDNFGSGANDCSGTPTVFDDQAAVTIASGVAPFAGSFRPDAALAGFNGKSANGLWKLRISDTAAADVGTVGCVTLEVNRRRYICCGVPGTPVVESAPPAVLTSESCPAPNGAVDPEETVTVEFPVRNVGDGATTNLVATLQNSGGVVPVTTSQSYGAVSPLDASPTSKPFTFVAQGSCGSIITATLQLQDGANNLGNVTYTFRLGTTALGTHSFSNNAPIAIPATGTSGPSAPFPSVINVSGVSGTVSRVAVRLKGMNHTFPDDVDVLLVSPTGQKFIVMSDAGGSVDLVNNTVTIDDTAANAIPDSAAIGTATFKPTNYATGDTFSAPAPAAPYQSPAPAGGATSASVFGGQNPNGSWRLYVQDDVSGDSGNVSGGWDLVITTEDPVCCIAECTITPPADIVVPNDPGQCGANVSYPPATVSGSCGVLSYSQASGTFFPIGLTTVGITATRADSSVADTASFGITVVDAEAPGMSGVTASPDSLWPPNHKMKDVTLTYNSADNCGGAGGTTCVVTGVTSNEPVNGTGDGDTAPDWVVVSPTKVQLRAERSGGGTGRTYTITVTCTDGAGNQTVRTATVNVPHSQ